MRVILLFWCNRENLVAVLAHNGRDTIDAHVAEYCRRNDCTLWHNYFGEEREATEVL